MKKSRVVLTLLFIIPLAIYVHAQKNNEDEGIEDDPNHPRTVEIMREHNRVEREFTTVYNMLIEILDDKEYIEEFDYHAKRSKRNLQEAYEAWSKYQEAELNLETQLFGSALQGYPGTEDYHKCDTELSLERIARMRKVIEKIYKNRISSDSNGKLTIKIKGMIEAIDKMSKERNARKANFDKKYR